MTALEPRLDLRQFSLLSVAVFAAIVPHLQRLPWSLAILLPTLLVARWWQRRWRPRPVSTLIKLPLALLLVVLTVLQFGNVFGREPGSALACGMLVLKLVESERARDARAAVLFAAFVLMSALLFTQSLFFTVFLTLVLILLLAVLRQLQARPAAHDEGWRAPLLHYLRDAGLSLLVGVPLALCAFLLIPRFSSPLWGAPGDGDAAHTGLSDRMSPGDISELLNDDSPAFRVGFDGAIPAPAQRYWRGPVLWNFDGRNWTRPSWADVPDASVRLTDPADTIGYDVTQEPGSQRWMLALDLPLEAPPEATRASDFTMYGRRIDTTTPRRYHVRSATAYRLEPELPEGERRHALQLPQGFNPRTLAWAQQLRTGHGNDDEALVRAVLQHFHDEFSYTQAPPLLGRESVDEFLFDTHAGFCEHFSSAFTFAMRAAGIPARVVTGYQGGYLNSVGRYLLVRQSDAHAWSEIWLAGRGWLRIDPTAEVSPSRIEIGAAATRGGSEPWYRPDWIANLRNQLDLANRWWNEAIVQFNALRQAGLLKPFGVDHADYGQLVSVLGASISVLLALMTLWTLRRGRDGGDALDRAYARLRRKLGRAGVVFQRRDGPLDACRRAGAALPAMRGVIEDLTRRYVNLRYASALEDRPAVRAFERDVRDLRVSKGKR